MSSLAQFHKDVDKFEEGVSQQLSDASAGAAVLLFAKIVSRTPYATGRARSSWQINIGSPNKNVNNPGKYPQYADASAAYMLAADEALIKLAGYRVPLIGPKPAIWITNRLRYIPFLERGHSKQAPAGMVALSVEEVKSQFAQIATKSGKGGHVGITVS